LNYYEKLGCRLTKIKRDYGTVDEHWTGEVVSGNRVLRVDLTVQRSMQIEENPVTHRLWQILQEMSDWVGIQAVQFIGVEITQGVQDEG